MCVPPPPLLFVDFISQVYLSRAIFCQSLLGAGNSENPERGCQEGPWRARTSRPHRQFPIPSAPGASGTRLAHVSYPGLLWARGKEWLPHTTVSLQAWTWPIPSRGARPATHVPMSPHPWGGEENKESPRREADVARQRWGRKATSFMLLSLWRGEACLKQSA